MSVGRTIDSDSTVSVRALATGPAIESMTESCSLVHARSLEIWTSAPMKAFASTAAPTSTLWIIDRTVMIAATPMPMLTKKKSKRRHDDLISRQDIWRMNFIDWLPPDRFPRDGGFRTLRPPFLQSGVGQRRSCH